ncbi:hypothetical protein D3C73_745160 [compost metagenome]
MGGGAIGAGLPGRAFLGDGSDTALAGFEFPAQAFIAGTRFGQPATIGCNSGLLVTQAIVEIRQVRGIFEFYTGVFALNIDIFNLRIDLIERLGDYIAATHEIA